MADDIARVSQFIAFQHSRTPQSKLFHDARQRLGDLVEETPDRVPDHFEDDWRDTIYYNANEGHESLQFMGWRIVENETDVPFITSDKPVVHYFEQDFEEVDAVDEELHGREIFCPLDQNHLLMLLDPEIFSVESQWPNAEINRVTVSDRREVHKFNMLQCVWAFQELFGPVGYGDLLERTVQVICDAFEHEDFIRGNREDLETIEIEDVKRAVKLIRQSLEDVGIDPETGVFDADVIETGTSMSQHERMKSIKRVVEELNNCNTGSGPTVEDIVAELDVSAEKANKALEKLAHKGEVYNPQTDHYRTT